jgi:uncharacterized protein (TIGR02246 family)
MQAEHHEMEHLNALAHEWVAAWNARDVERVLALYAEDCEMTSDVIVRLGVDTSGTVQGKSSLRSYWSKALAGLPDLHFDLIDIFASPDSVVVFYKNQRGAQICEYLRLDAQGKIVQGSANHKAH